MFFLREREREIEERGEAAENRVSSLCLQIISHSSILYSNQNILLFFIYTLRFGRLQSKSKSHQKRKKINDRMENLSVSSRNGVSFELEMQKS